MKWKARIIVHPTTRGLTVRSFDNHAVQYVRPNFAFYTAKIGSLVIDDWVSVSEITRSIDCNPNIAPQRKSFLKRRLDYWLEWKRSEIGPRSYSMRDWE